MTSFSFTFLSAIMKGLLIPFERLITKRSNRLSLSLLLLSLFGFAPEGIAGWAATSLGVSVNVVNHCVIATSPKAFKASVVSLSRTADNSTVTGASTELDATAGVSVTCTKGVTMTIAVESRGPVFSAGAPSPKAESPAVTLVSYVISQEPAPGPGWSSIDWTAGDKAIPPNRVLRHAAAREGFPAVRNLPAGGYLDTLVATVNF